MSAAIELIKKEVYRFMSIWVQTVIGPVSTAVLYQLIFGSQLTKLTTGINGVNYTTFLIPGLIMMQVLLNAFGNSSSSIIQAKYTGNIIFILMAPITPVALYSAYLISSVVRGLVVGVAVLIGIAWFGISIPSNIWAVFYFLLLGATITGGLGIIAGTLCDKFDQLAGFQSFVMVPLIYLSGIFFNPTHLHGIWSYIAMLDPFLYIVDGFRYGFIDSASYSMLLSSIFVGSVSVIINTIGYLILKNGIKIKH